MEDNKDKKDKNKKTTKLSWKSVVPIVAVSTLISCGVSAGVAYAFAQAFKYDVPSFTIKFVNNDDSLIKQYTVDLGTMPVYDGNDPTYQNPEDYVTYTFKGWDRDITPAVSDATYKASYDAVHQTYTAMFYANLTDTSSFNSYTLNKGVYPKSTDDGWQEPPKKQPEGATQYTFCSFQPRTEGFDKSIIEFDAIYDEAALGLTFSETNDQVTIESFDQNKYIEAGGSLKLELPEEWNNKPVTRINDNAFKGCDRITAISLPDSITTIGAGAFDGCTLVSEINLPNNSLFKTVSANTFKSCSSLSEIEIPDSVTRINDNAFEGCSSLKTFTIGKNVSDFNPTAISDCAQLNKIEVDDENEKYMSYNGIMLLDKNGTTIYRCVPNLSEDNQDIDYNDIPETVTTISANAFASCNVVTIDLNNTSISSIEAGAFNHCEKLDTFSTGDNIDALSDGMFAGCINLYTLNLGAKVNIYLISSTAFGTDCTKLTVITVDNGNETLMSDNNILYSKVKNDQQVYEAKALLRCPPNKNVAEISIPTTVDTIAGYAFKWNVSENIKIPEGIKIIGENAFESCANLKTLELPNTVISIGANAADSCFSLETIKLGSSIDYDSISSSAMVGCVNLKEILVDPSNTSLLSIDGILYNKANQELGLEDKDIIYRCPPGKDFSIVETVNLDGVKLIADYAFKDTKIKSISIPTSVTEIRSMAFNGCNQLTNVTFVRDLPESLASNAFSDDANKINFYFTDSFHDVNTGTVDYIATLQKNLGHPINVKLGCKNGTIGKKWFANCTSINELSFDNTVTGFGEEAFANCSNVQKLALPNGLQTIGEGSFRKLSQLTTLDVPGVSTISNSAFASLLKCENVTINEGTTVIGGYAFDTFQKLEQLVLPTTLTTIQDNAFQKVATETSNKTLDIYFGGTFTDTQWYDIVGSRQDAVGKFGGGGTTIKLRIHCTNLANPIEWEVY